MIVAHNCAKWLITVHGNRCFALDGNGISLIGISYQTVPNELFCSKSGEEPLNITHFPLILWHFEPFWPLKRGRNISKEDKIVHLAQSVYLNYFKGVGGNWLAKNCLWPMSWRCQMGESASLCPLDDFLAWVLVFKGIRAVCWMMWF